MQLSICDVCQCPIKPNAKKYAMAVQEMIEDRTQYNDALDYLQAQQRKYGNIQVKEICESCKKIYDRFFQLRKDEIKKLNKEIDSSFNQKEIENKNDVEEYCTCLDPEPDWDNQKWGENFLKCTICGKKIKPYDTNH